MRKTYKTCIKVRGYHTDFYGHVNNARYLEFLEEARWEFTEEYLNYEELGKKGLLFIVVNININYRRPAGLGEILQIESYLDRVSRRSGIVHQDIFLKDTNVKVADADVTFVVFDQKKGKSQQIV